MSTPTDSTDDLLTLAAVARRIPGARGSKQLHPATVTRWILNGARATDGTVVRLTATRAGHRWLVRAADVDAFFDALAAPALAAGSRPPVPRRTRDRAAGIAGAALEEMGA